MKKLLPLVLAALPACMPEQLPEQVEASPVLAALSIDPNATYTLTGSASGKCIGIAGASTANSAAVELRTCNGSAAQKFRLAVATTGYYTMTNVNSGKCLDVTARSTADNAKIIQYACSGATNQQWAVTDTNGGAVKLTARHSGKVMGAYLGGAAEGTGIVQQTWNSAAYQNFVAATVSVCASGPVGRFSGALADGITFLDDHGVRVNAHGGGIIQDGNTYYMHGQYFVPSATDNNFHGFSMYSSKDLATWKSEGIILPQQPSGELGPNRKGERPHIVKCPATGEFVLFAHAADVTYQADKEVVYATSKTVNGQYAYKGPLLNASGAKAQHSDMSAVVDQGKAYVVTESGHVYTLSADCHSWLSDQAFGAVNLASGGGESPTIFRAGSTLYWIASNKTGWRANDNEYSTAPTMTGPWTHQGLLAPAGQKTWLSQSTWVVPVVGCKGTTYVYWGDHWYGTESTAHPGLHNDLATYVFQPIVFSGTQISLPTYNSTWKLDVGLGTWSL